MIPWELIKAVNPKVSLGYQARQKAPIIAEKVVINNECVIDGLIIADTVVLMSGSKINGPIICQHLKEAGGDIYGNNAYLGTIYAWAEVVLHPDVPSQVAFLVSGPDANSQYSMIRRSETLDQETWMDRAVRENAAVIKAAAEELKLDWLTKLVDGL